MSSAGWPRPGDVRGLGLRPHSGNLVARRLGSILSPGFGPPAQDVHPSIRSRGPRPMAIAADMTEFQADLPAKETGHPRGLYVLFGAEMWERFSYYGMRALLVLYLTKHLNFARKDALALYATY